MTSLKKGILIGAAVVVVGIQAVPAGRNHTNPPVTQEPNWDSPQTRELAQRACFDCHSNETRWPWYSNIAPVSWLVQRDVDEGRQHLNFSEFDKPQQHADDSTEVVNNKEMPMWFYVPLHGEAKLSDAERAQLVAGLRATIPERRREFGRGGERGQRGEFEGRGEMNGQRRGEEGERPGEE